MRITLSDGASKQDASLKKGGRAESGRRPSPPIGGMDGLSALPAIVGCVEVEGASVRGVHVLPALVFSRVHVVHRGQYSRACHGGRRASGVQGAERGRGARNHFPGWRTSRAVRETPT